MTAIIWAKTVECDWPRCPVQGDVTLGDLRRPNRMLPDGWTDLRATGLTLTNFEGNGVAEFCPDHSAEPVSALAAAFHPGTPR